MSKDICDVKYSLPGHDLPISLKDRLISLFHEGFIFTKLRVFKGKYFIGKD